MSTPPTYQEIYKKISSLTRSVVRSISYPLLNYSEPNYRIPGIVHEQLSEYEKQLNLSKIIDDADTIDKNSPDSIHTYVQVAISIFLFQVCC